MSSRLVMGLDDVAKIGLIKPTPLFCMLYWHMPKRWCRVGKIALPRLIALLEAICRRSIYLVMLSENPDATVRLIPTLSASLWIARELAHHPVLLDTFLQKRYLHLPDKAELTDILRQSLLRIEPFDDEGYLTTIRLFKKLKF